jgi:hypothetical protein
VPISDKTGFNIGHSITYGHPVALLAANGQYLSFRRHENDKLLETVPDRSGWEQFSFVQSSY